MTAHQCCPGCGVELTADGGSSCGCSGPFTAEHVDPMHIRPYVDLPEPEPEPSAGPDLEPFAQCGTDETAELPAVLPPEQAPGRGARLPGAERQYGSRAGGHRRRKGRGTPAAAGGNGHDGHGGHGSHDRPRGRGLRRPGTAALAAAGVVAALGAGLFTTQALTGSDSTGDRSHSTDDHALPVVPSGGPTESPSRTEREQHKGHSRPSAGASRTAAPVTPRANRDSDAHTSRGAVSPSTSSSSSDAPGRSGWGDGRRNGYPHHSQRPTEQPSRSSGDTLRPGDSGPEVAELQRRLKQAGALQQDAPEDGVYSSDVQQAVARYQEDRDVRGDNYGEYGPYTRRALESQTTG